MALVGEEGVKSTEQVPDDRVQVPAGVPVKVPDPPLLKLTVPDGVVGLTELSVTVAVQIVAMPTSTVLGLQETEVVVAGRTGEVTVSEIVA